MGSAAEETWDEVRAKGARPLRGELIKNTKVKCGMRQK